VLVKKNKRWIRRKMRVVKRIQMDRINRKFLRNRSEGERDWRIRIRKWRESKKKNCGLEE